jgi:hypothetical protein
MWGGNLLSSNASISTLPAGSEGIIALGTNSGLGQIGIGTVIIGNQISAEGGESVGIGWNSNVDYQSVSIGTAAESVNYSIAIGSGSKAYATNATAIGYNAQVNSAYSIAIGNSVNVSSSTKSTRKIGSGKHSYDGPNFLETTWSKYNFNDTGPAWIGANGTSATISESTSSTYAKDLTSLLGTYGIFNGKVKFIMRYYNDDASNDIRIAEQDVTLFRAGSNNYTLVTGTLNDLYNGGGGNCSQWEPSLVMHTTNPNYLLCKFDAQGTSVGSGIQIYAILSGNAITY